MIAPLVIEAPANDLNRIEEEVKGAEPAAAEQVIQNIIEISLGSHGEIDDSDINENIIASLPEKFPWQV